MNKDNAHLYLPLVQALADGKVIQSSSGYKDARVWVDRMEVSLTGEPECYRIKPEPREGWIVVTGPGALMSESAARCISGGRYEVIHVREVLPP